VTDNGTGKRGKRLNSSWEGNQSEMHKKLKNRGGTREEMEKKKKKDSENEMDETPLEEGIKKWPSKL